MMGQEKLFRELIISGVIAPPFRWEQDCENSIRIFDYNNSEIATIVAEDDEISRDEEGIAKFICDACNHYSIVVRGRK